MKFVAFNSAIAVQQTPNADRSSTAPVQNASASGKQSDGTFNDSLNEVLAQPAQHAAKRKANFFQLANPKIAKLKSKTGTAAPDQTQAALQIPAGQTPIQQSAAAQTVAPQASHFLQKLQGDSADTKGIDLSALRATLGQHKMAGNRLHTLPIAAPASGKVDAKAAAEAGAATDAKTGAQDKTDASTDPSQKAVTADNQAKLVAALADAAKTPAAKAASAADPQIAQKLADAAKTTPVTKLETAAITNTTQAAEKAPTPQAKIEAQALPVNFGSAKPADGKNAGTQTNTGGKDGDAKSGSERTAADTAPDANANAIKTPDAPQPQSQVSAPSTPAAHDAPATSTNMDAAGTGAAAPSAPATPAPSLQVAQQAAQHSAPADHPDLAALGVSIAARSKDGDKQFDISMHPAELGRVDVRLSVDADGKTQAHLVAEKPQTLQLLQNDKAHLEQSLKDAGLDLSNNGLNFSLKGEQQPSTPTFNTRSRALSIAAVQSTDTSSISSTGAASGDSRLDIRV